MYIVSTPEIIVVQRLFQLSLLIFMIHGLHDGADKIIIVMELYVYRFRINYLKYIEKQNVVVYKVNNCTLNTDKTYL